MENNAKLVPLPFQIIEEEDSVIIKRGVDEMIIPDSNALVVVRVIQKALLQSPKTIEELLTLFSGPMRPIVENFIQHLIKKRFILKENDKIENLNSTDEETPQDIFYWHFNQFQKSISENLNQKKWVFIGINALSKRLIQAVKRDKFKNLVAVDDPSLRNIHFFNDKHELVDDFWLHESIEIVDEDTFFQTNVEAIGFIIASSEFGSFFLLERWNEFAVKQGIAFYPIVLQNMIGYAGPLVIPEECACLACLKARQNSHSPYFQEKRLTEKYAFESQSVVAYHEAMLSILAEVGIFDLIKFKTNIQWEIGTFCEIDLLAGSMVRRKLLKAPRCPVCSEISKKPLINIHKQLTSDESWKKIQQTVGYNE